MLNKISAVDAIEGLKKGKFTCHDLTAACLEQIEKFDHHVKAWVYIDKEKAMLQAEAVDRKIRDKSKLGMLPGIPIGIKDIFNTKDMPTQMGSPIWKDFRPGNDARVVHYLKMADAVILGKTVTAEFAVHTPGPTCNPHNLVYMAGTSSTGSAVSVASYMVPLALGTQTAGSTIRPASYTGIYGFKPSFGLIPRTAMLKTTDSLDTVGFFARTIEDIELMFEVIRVHGLDYPLSNTALMDPQRRNVSNRKWRVAVICGPKWGDAERYAQEALCEYAERLDKVSDVELIEPILPECLWDAHEVHKIIYDRTLAYYFREEYKKQTLVSSIMYKIIEDGNHISLDQYKKALEAQENIARQMDIFFEENRIDVIVDLSTGGEALKGLGSTDRPDNCLVWTLCGLPAINVPLFLGPNRLPFGAQFVSRRYNDYITLNFIRKLRYADLANDGPNPVPNLNFNSTDSGAEV